ncbi:uncharacterized protein LOC110226465, partial [Arabidopsis lyrata subsp. lyrata]|uniref:uncharacterized protein LOC110226465 n=1 Tax=Arabidopsis lyrata subsp. lyrata TaxID=81972 RepID=UPI000A29EA8E
CALHKNVWDGKDLDGVPEEDDWIDDGEPFERITDGIILHPFHSHHLRLEIFMAYDKNKYCRGCALPVYEGQFYSCMECKFILHESCANAPRMKRHPLHPYPLTLDNMASAGKEGKTKCSACKRDVGGFYYYHHSKEPVRTSILLDLRCALIIEPFEFQGHKHPLFLPWDLKEKTRCQICKEVIKHHSEFQFGREVIEHHSELSCMDCDYTICFHCATLPYKVRYKHDSHFLIICDGKKASDQQDWCEICERNKERRHPDLNPKVERRIYKCSDCCTTIHAECLLGADIYLRSGQTIKYGVSYSDCDLSRVDVQIILNNSLSRPICKVCHCRCPFPIYFKSQSGYYCSSLCIERLIYNSNERYWRSR